MNKISLRTVVFFMFIISVSFSSCAAIGGVFKAGVWVGVIAVVVVISVIFWLINKAGKK